MTIMLDAAHRGWNQGSAHGGVCLADKFEIVKDIGDGSFGSVSLARVRAAGSHVARRGTMVAIKTMKRTFDSFAPCLELREIIFLRTLSHHPHLVPALDIFLDPLSKKLHIAMEYMDGNLYQLIKARDHKPFDETVVKSILFQILSGLEHIHQNGFFHRDIKPENILVSMSAREDFGTAIKRYSQIMTPPSTPPAYSIKIADFGLAREINSNTPYTHYVSTRWYRAPEVLLRAGQYGPPVDIWATGAMAVEIAMLKPLFPGANEVDQVWRICEIMGSPGHWVDKQNLRVGGGSWKAGSKIARDLGFAFPKMAPHRLDTIMSPPWSAALCDWITWCLMWDPNHRPTCSESLKHEYFNGAFDPLQSKTPNVKFLTRRQSDINISLNTQTSDATQTLTSKRSSWFRRSLIARDSAPAVQQHVPPMAPPVRPLTPRASPVKPEEQDPAPAELKRPAAKKRSTWNIGSLGHGAPMPILPSIRPISPLSNTITAQAYAEPERNEQDATKKLGRQLSYSLTQGHQPADIYRPDLHRTHIEDSLPAPEQKESFFSHLRKRARRISARHVFPPTPRADDIEANIGCAPWNGVSHAGGIQDGQVVSGLDPADASGFAELDRVMRDIDSATREVPIAQQSAEMSTYGLPGNPLRKRHHSVPLSQETQVEHDLIPPAADLSLRSPMRKDRRISRKPVPVIDPSEAQFNQAENLDKALNSAQEAVSRLDRQYGFPIEMNLDFPSFPDHRRPFDHSFGENFSHRPYPTPSSSNKSDKRHTIGFLQSNYEPQPIDINTSKRRSEGGYPFPTPPYEANEWAAAAAAAIIGAGDQWQ